MKILLCAVHAEEKGWRQIAAELAAKGHEIVLLSAEALNKSGDGIKNICVKRLREIKKICRDEALCGNKFAFPVFFKDAGKRKFRRKQKNDKDVGSLAPAYNSADNGGDFCVVEASDFTHIHAE